MADVVGTAYVRIRAITTGLGDDIKDAVDKGMDFDFAGKFKENFARGMREGAEAGAKEHDRVSKDHQKNWLKSWDKSLSKWKKMFKIPGKFWLLALGIPALGGALKLAASYIITLVGQLGYVVTAAVGAGGALVGAFGLALLGVLPLILAFKTETEALDKFKESLKEQADAWKEVGAAVQEGLLPPLTDATQLLSSEFIPLFQEAGREVGRIFGDVVRRIGNVLTTEGAMQSWGEVFKSVGPFMTAIGDALVQIARILPPLLEVTAPLAVDLAEALDGALRNFADFVTAGAQSGTLSDNLNLWWDRAKLIGEALWNIIEALWEIFRVGADVVSPQFDTLVEKTQGWVDKLRSPEGQDGLRRIFENALPVAQEVNGLFGDIIDMIIKPIFGGDTENLVGFLQTIRTEILPPLGTLAQTLSQNLGDSLLGFFEALIPLLQVIADSGLFGTFLTVLTEFLDKFTELLEMPGMNEAVIQFLIFFGTIGAILKIFSPFVKILLLVFNLFEGGWKFVKFLWDILLKIGPAIAAVAGWFETVAIWALYVWDAIVKVGGIISGALLPIAEALGISLGALFGWIVAIVAAIIGIIWVITHWSEVTEFLGEVWENIVEVFGVVWEAIKEFFGNLGGIISEKAGQLWEWIQEAIPEAIAAIGRFISGIFAFLGSLPRRLLTFFANAAVALWEWIQKAIPIALSWLGRLIGNILGFIIFLPVRIARFLMENITAFYQWIADAIPKALEWIGNLINTVMTFILGLPIRIRNALINATKALWDWVQKAAPKVVEWLGNIWNKILGWFTETLPKLIVQGKQMLTNFLKWIVDAIRDIPGKLAEFAQKVWNWVTGFLDELPRKLIEGRDKLIEMGKDFLGAIVEGLESALSTVWEWAGDFIEGIIDGIADQADNAGIPFVGNWLRGLVGGGGGASRNAPAGGGTTPASVAGFSALRTTAIPLATPLALAGAGASANQALASQTPRSASGLSLVVQIGERDITDIVDARISDNDLATSQALFVTRRG